MYYSFLTRTTKTTTLMKIINYKGEREFMTGILIGLIPIIVIPVSIGFIVGLAIQGVVHAVRARRIRNRVNRANDTIRTAYIKLGIDIDEDEDKDIKSFEEK